MKHIVALGLAAVLSLGYPAVANAEEEKLNNQTPVEIEEPLEEEEEVVEEPVEDVEPTPSPTPTPTPTETDEPLEEPTEDPVEEVEVESVDALLDDDLHGERVIVKLTDGTYASGEVEADEKTKLEDLPEVDLVEADRPVSSLSYDCDNIPDGQNWDSTCQYWGLDRINQADLPLDDYYPRTSEGTGVKAYIIDTGIDYNSTYLSNASSTGFDAVGGDTWADGRWQIVDGDPMDCQGHGTHVAGTVGSERWGVAPGVELIGVRVLNCGGSGWTSDVIDGITWVEYQKSLNPSTPMVANLSLGGSYSPIMNEAVRDLQAAGVIVVAAAGNDSSNASNASPASEPSITTVGASDWRDDISYFSNYGTVVDVFAPGSSITSAYLYNSMKTWNGTSMASPHVAGVAAAYLADGGTASGWSSWLSSNATSTISLSSNATMAGTTTKLVQYNVAANPDPDPEPTPTPTPTPTPEPEPAPAPPAPAPPAPAPAPPSGGGGSSGGGSSGGGSSGGGGGGSLNEITTVSSRSGPAGTLFALAGYGLETTRIVWFGPYQADFVVRHGGHVDVWVPDVPAGNYVVHAQLAPEVGRASWWEGFTVTEGSVYVPPLVPAPPTTPTDGTVGISKRQNVVKEKTARGTTVTLQNISENYDYIQVLKRKGKKGNRSWKQVRYVKIDNEFVAGDRENFSILFSRKGVYKVNLKAGPGLSGSMKVAWLRVKK